MRRRAFSLALLALIPGCGASLSLTDVIAVVSEAAMVLDAIAGFAKRYFAGKPNADLEAKVEKALEVARAALQAAAHAGRGLDAAAKESAASALNEFINAYQALLDLTRAIGVTVGTSALKASPDGAVLVVPKPEAFRALR